MVGNTSCFETSQCCALTNGMDMSEVPLEGQLEIG